jgi:hypothetical protein
MEVTMKRFLWAIPLVFVLISLRANANSITTIFLIPNDGSGDNFGFFQQSPTRTIEVQGGIPFSVFNAFGFAPGSNLGGTTDVFFDNGSIVIGGISHDLAFNETGTLFISSITLPTNGANGFSTLVTLTFSVGATTVDTFQPVNIFGGATGTATFSLFDGNYYAQGITATSTVPEPGAFGLVGTGVLSILAAFRKKLTV